MVHWNSNVLEMAFKTSRFVQGLPRTPWLCFLLFPKAILFQICCTKTIVLKTENLKIWKSKNPGSLTSAQKKVRSKHDQDSFCFQKQMCRRGVPFCGKSDLSCLPQKQFQATKQHTTYKVNSNYCPGTTQKRYSNSQHNWETVDVWFCWISIWKGVWKWRGEIVQIEWARF